MRYPVLVVLLLLIIVGDPRRLASAPLSTTLPAGQRAGSSAIDAAVPTLEFVPGVLHLRGNQSIGSVDLVLRGAADLAGYEIELSYAPALVNIKRVERVIGTDASPSPGRTWTTLPVSDNPDITFLQRAPGQIAFGAFSYSSAPRGLDGDLILARIYVRSLAQGASTLRADRVLLTDSAARPTTPAPASSQVVTLPTNIWLPYILR